MGASRQRGTFFERKKYIFDKQRSNRKGKREGVREGTKVKRKEKDCRGVHIYKTRVYAGV